jgi:hypothetical protein
MKSRRWQILFWTAAAALVACVCPLRAQEKLYLKDGSYQLVKSYETKGDRVRYYSLDRSEWEEVPKSLVDFKATEQAKEREKSQKTETVEKAKQIESQRHEQTAKAGFEIKPGVPLPADAGAYILDGTQVLRMVQSTAEVVSDKRRKFLSMAMPAPLLKNQSLVVLDGVKAAIRVATEEPVFYIESPDNWGAKAELIPLEVHKDTRVVEKIDSGIGLGKSGEQRGTIPVEKTQVAPGILKIKPARPLNPGEYAIGEMLAPGKLNLEVWDFGIEGTTLILKKQ